VTVRAALDNLRIPSEAVGELVLGDGLLGSGTIAPARRVIFEAGLPETTPSLAVDRACCSGMAAVGLGAQKVAAGDHEVVVAGGAQAMSQTPWLLRAPRTAHKPVVGALEAEDILVMHSPISDAPIARYVGEVAQSYGIDRAAQDEWAIRSHERYFAAYDVGRLQEEIHPLSGEDRKQIDVDEQARRNIDVDKLSQLPTVYGSPTVTAANAPGLNDGASVVLLASDEYAAAHELPVLGRIVGHVGISGAPDSSAYLPAHALSRLLETTGRKLRDITVVEINEAFAATALVSLKVLTDDYTLRNQLEERLNPNGGAVAIGHPIGASGARVTLAAALETRRRGGGLAAAAICGGFGQADAILIEVD
jgi:acetyl-CoA C-acetyltransferase